LFWLDILYRPVLNSIDKNRIALLEAAGFRKNGLPDLLVRADSPFLEICNAENQYGDADNYGQPDLDICFIFVSHGIKLHNEVN